jgi:hypothetical protein
MVIIVYWFFYPHCHVNVNIGSLELDAAINLVCNLDLLNICTYHFLLMVGDGCSLKPMLNVSLVATNKPFLLEFFCTKYDCIKKWHETFETRFALPSMYSGIIWSWMYFRYENLMEGLKWNVWLPLLQQEEVLNVIFT